MKRLVSGRGGTVDQVERYRIHPPRRPVLGPTRKWLCAPCEILLHLHQTQILYLVEPLIVGMPGMCAVKFTETPQKFAEVVGSCQL